ncbi:uncharacterized protein (DUF305 family) [Deinococcus metalli]|uniref:DUF305 domain-containing protein n=1 Tax=Deinococcus metalli TaxID=1141878 RepID=A0A7W8KI00_9DEIO|nr:DUF305 domain-containing protein [Deinococcus metalli]MBB5378133.1 uncharacterized protein (DUF305 family) [Deinococcus metalli]GHF56269.1 DUF305 domain-containing protein [Deinococcus metalli]
MTPRPRWPALLLLLLLAGLAAFALFAPGRSAPAETSREVTFVRGMIQHHAQAVDMATRIRDRSRDRTLRSLALDIILSQQEQIGQMRGWLTLWNRPWAGAGMDAEHARMMGMATPTEVASLDTLPEARAEVTFLQLMRRHHQGALAMVRPVLDQPARPEVQALARQINATQSAEIRVMDSLLKQRGASPLPTPGGADQMPGMDMGSDSHDMPMH